MIDNPASAFQYSFGRVWDIPYGWNRPVCVNPVLVGPVLS